RSLLRGVGSRGSTRRSGGGGKSQLSPVKSRSGLALRAHVQRRSRRRCHDVPGFGRGGHRDGGHSRGRRRGQRLARRPCRRGLVVLAVLVAVFGLALTAIPIGILRLVVGALLLIVGLNWLRKGIRRLAAQGLRGSGPGDPGPTEEEEVPRDRRDWTGFVLAFKGVLLEGLEVAFIVVTFGGTSNQLGVAVVAAIGALVLVAAFGLAIQPLVRRIPRSALQLAVGLLLTTFGTFWAVEGVGVDWPGSDAAIVGLLGLYVV